MAEFESHAPGTFCWPELATSDQKRAVAFYRALFGWEVTEQAIGPDDVYTMFQLRGKEVGAASTLRPEQRQQGARPHWSLYVSVTSADDSVRRAQQLGATPIAEPFDVFDAGRMAVLQDPTGAIISVWQPKKHIGARVLNEPGALCWGNIPLHWLPYFQVTDCDKSAERAKELGGRIHVPPGDIPNAGRLGMLSDPQGGMFAVFTPRR